MIGHGHDVHSLVEGRRCIIGGVYSVRAGPDGHSTRMCLTHAVMDASAPALGDIGAFSWRQSVSGAGQRRVPCQSERQLVVSISMNKCKAAALACGSGARNPGHRIRVMGPVAR
ncbi:MAG: 2-C-methyl-D-erythritol 2,4-cyclodiphosphate synthase [Butyricicoccaceae bacterium]